MPELPWGKKASPLYIGANLRILVEMAKWRLPRTQEYRYTSIQEYGFIYHERQEEHEDIIRRDYRMNKIEAGIRILLTDWGGFCRMVSVVTNGFSLS